MNAELWSRPGRASALAGVCRVRRSIRWSTHPAPLRNAVLPRLLLALSGFGKRGDAWMISGAGAFDAIDGVADFEFFWDMCGVRRGRADHP